MCFSPNGERLASCADDGRVCVWRWSSSQCLRDFEPDEGKISNQVSVVISQHVHFVFLIYFFHFAFLDKITYRFIKCVCVFVCVRASGECGGVVSSPLLLDAFVGPSAVHCVRLVPQRADLGLGRARTLLPPRPRARLQEDHLQR